MHRHTLLFVWCCLASPIGQAVPIVLDDGGFHPINQTVDSIDVGNGSTAVLFDGASVAGDVKIGILPNEDTGTLTASGGTIRGSIDTAYNLQSAVTLGGSTAVYGTVYMLAQAPTFSVFDSAELFGEVTIVSAPAPGQPLPDRGAIVAGGTFHESVGLHNIQHVTISGGTFLSTVNINENVFGSIVDGTFLGPLLLGHYSEHTFDILGGEFLSDIRFGDGGTTNLYGGSFAIDSLWTIGMGDFSSILNIYGSKFSWTNNILSGRLADGQRFRVAINNLGSTLNLITVSVPEPTTLSLLGVGLLGVFVSRRRRVSA